MSSLDNRTFQKHKLLTAILITIILLILFVLQMLKALMSTFLITGDSISLVSRIYVIGKNEALIAGGLSLFLIVAIILLLMARLVFLELSKGMTYRGWLEGCTLPFFRDMHVYLGTIIYFLALGHSIFYLNYFFRPDGPVSNSATLSGIPTLLGLSVMSMFGVSFKVKGFAQRRIMHIITAVLLGVLVIIHLNFH